MFQYFAKLRMASSSGNSASHSPNGRGEAGPSDSTVPAAATANHGAKRRQREPIPIADNAMTTAIGPSPNKRLGFIDKGRRSYPSLA